MGQASTYTPEEIQRRSREFEVANHRDHARFVIGAIILAVLFAGGALLALSDF